ncbi:hypothetical protein ACU4GR_03210, partial [Methylobacterium oryzae CBMB20]
MTTGSITKMPRRPSTGRHGRPETSNATGRPDLSRSASPRTRGGMRLKPGAKLHSAGGPDHAATMPHCGRAAIDLPPRQKSWHR